MLLCEEDRPLPFLARRGRQMGVREGVGGALVQGSRGLPRRGVTLDPPVPRVGRLARDVADLQRLRVHPRAVDVAVQQEDGPVGDDVVEQVLGRCAAGEVRHEPAPAEDRRLVGVLPGVRRHRVSVRVHARKVVERHVQAIAAGERGVEMGVLERREHHPSREVEELLRVREPLPHVRFRAHRDDPVPADRHGARPPARRIHREHVGAGDHEVGGPGRLRHRAEDSPSDHRRRSCTGSAVV